MEFKRYDIKGGRQADWIYLHLLADIHQGSAGHNPQKFKERIDEIRANPFAYWATLGDMGEHIYYSDPRFSINEMDGNITLGDIKQGILGQIRKTCDKLEVIKDRCIGIMTGNHEETIVRRYHVDPAREIADRLNVNYLGYSALLALAVAIKGKKEHANIIDVFLHHGYGGGRRHGAQINKIEDAMRMATADIYAIGHVHGKVMSELNPVGITTTGEPKKRKKVFVVASSFQETIKQGVTTYAERMMMPEAPLGSPLVRFRWTGKNHELDIRIGT